MIRTEHKKYNSYPTLTIPLFFDKRRGTKRLKVKTSDTFSDAFIPAIADQTSIQIYFGGAGSGKSTSIARRTILDLLQGKRNFLIIRKIKEYIRDSFFAELEKAASSLGVYDLFVFNTSPLQVTCKLNGRKAIFRGMQHAKDQEKVKSITVRDGIITDVIVEEATEITEDDYDILDTRLRGICDVKKRITILFNPIHTEHWLYKRFFAGKFPEHAKVYRYSTTVEYIDPTGDIPVKIKEKKTIIIHKSTHWDNRFLANEDRVKYESYKDSNPYMYQVYTMGNWGVLGDLIFDNYQIRDLTKVAKTALTFEFGMDLGWDPDPYAFVVAAMRGKYIYVFKEMGGTRKTSREIKKEISPTLRDNVCFVESADGRTFGELEALGMGDNLVKVAKWKDNNSHAIQYLQNYEIIIDYRCIEFISEIKSYAWQKDKNGKSIRKPIDGDDHYLQALFYALNTKINSYRQTVMGR